MSRDILFRGKRVDNGKWVYGYYLVAAGMPFISAFGEREPIAVIPETVGQYTGLKDKNGVEIYEGDRLIQRMEIKNTRTHQSYKTPRFKELKGIIEFKDGCFDFKTENYRGQIRCYIGYEKNESQIEIIGNIHEEVKE